MTALALAALSSAGCTANDAALDLALQADQPSDTASLPTDARQEAADAPAAMDGVQEGPVSDAGPDQAGSGSLRVATFNCHCLLDPDPTTRAKGIAAEVLRLAADAVALQEICQLPGGGSNMAVTIAAELSATSGEPWGYRFAKTHVSWDQYEEGIGLLAPQSALGASGEHDLPQGIGPFPRKVAWARITTGRGTFLLYSTHLTISADWSDRLAQVQEVLALVASHLGQGLPQVVAGDFNDKDWSGPIQAMMAGPPAFIDAWATAHPRQPGNTIECPNPTERIDYIFLRDDSTASVVAAQVAFNQPYQGIPCLSDHLGVVAELSLSP